MCPYTAGRPRRSIDGNASFTDTLHSLFLLHASYTYTITFFGDYKALEQLIWSVQATVLINGLIAFVVQVCTSPDLSAERRT